MSLSVRSLHGPILEGLHILNTPEEAQPFSFPASSSRSGTGEKVDTVVVKRRRLLDGAVQAIVTEAPIPLLTHKKVRHENEKLAESIRLFDPVQRVLPRPLWDLIYVFNHKNDTYERLLEAAEADEQVGLLQHQGPLWSPPRAGFPPYITQIELIRIIVAKSEFQENPALYMATWPKINVDRSNRDHDRANMEQEYNAWKAAGARKNMRYGETYGNLFLALKYIEDFLGEAKG